MSEISHALIKWKHFMKLKLTIHMYESWILLIIIIWYNLYHKEKRKVNLTIHLFINQSSSNLNGLFWVLLLTLLYSTLMATPFFTRMIPESQPLLLWNVSLRCPMNVSAKTAGDQSRLLINRITVWPFLLRKNSKIRIIIDILEDNS